RLRVWRSSMVSLGTPQGVPVFLASSSDAFAPDPTSLLGRGAAPDAVRLAVAQRVVQTLGPDRARGTDGDGLGLLVGRGRIEDLGVEAPACRARRPGSIPHGQHNAPRTERIP